MLLGVTDKPTDMSSLYVVLSVITRFLVVFFSKFASEF